MKNIVDYAADKYEDNSLYSKVEDGIYLYDNPPDVRFNFLHILFKTKKSHGFKYRYGLMFTSDIQPKIYVTSLCFEQEPSLGESDSYISQRLAEDILDKFDVSVSDFYTDLNAKNAKKSYQEFASEDLKDVKELRSIIGKHVYERPSKKDEDTFLFVIE